MYTPKKVRYYAGIPNWRRLFDIGKLPSDAKHHIPGLLASEEAQARIEELEKDNAKLRGKVAPVELFKPLEPIVDTIVIDANGTGPTTTSLNLEEVIEPVSRGQEITCSFAGCEYVAKGVSVPDANKNLQLHMKIHKKK